MCANKNCWLKCLDKPRFGVDANASVNWHIILFFVCVFSKRDAAIAFGAFFFLNFKRVSSRKMLLLNTIVVWLIKAWLELPTGFSLPPPSTLYFKIKNDYCYTFLFVSSSSCRSRPRPHQLDCARALEASIKWRLFFLSFYLYHTREYYWDWIRTTPKVRKLCVYPSGNLFFFYF